MIHRLVSYGFAWHFIQQRITNVLTSTQDTNRQVDRYSEHWAVSSEKEHTIVTTNSLLNVLT